MSENSERTAITCFADIARLITRSRKARERGAWRDAETLQDEMRDLPLSVEVRSGWRSLDQQFEAAEYHILLCTGGLAVQVAGSLDSGYPSDARIEHQDWFETWRTWSPRNPDRVEAVLLELASLFYFGE